jgi:hypothetical protein
VLGGVRVEGRCEGKLRERLGVEKQFVAVEHTRDIFKKSMVHNGATPDITVDPETYEVTADGELLTCAPAEVLPMAAEVFSVLMKPEILERICAMKRASQVARAGAWRALARSTGSCSMQTTDCGGASC